MSFLDAALASAAQRTGARGTTRPVVNTTTDAPENTHRSSATQSLNDNVDNAQDTKFVSAEIAKSCLELVNKFRSGEKDKTITLVEIGDLIPNGPGQDDQYVAALRSYHQLLDNYERYRDGAASRGGAALPGNTSGNNNEQPIASGVADGGADNDADDSQNR